MKMQVKFGSIVFDILLAIIIIFSTTSGVRAYQGTVKPTFKTIIIEKYAPYTFVNEQGQPAGFSVDLMQAVALVMDINLEIRVDTWDNARRALENGEIDFLPMMAYSAERDKLYDFSPPHTIAYDAFFTRKNTGAILAMGDLQGKTIIVMKSDQAYDYLLSINSIKVEQLKLVDSLPEALRLLASGMGYTALMPKLVGLSLIKDLDLSNLDPSPAVVKSYTRPFSFTVRQGDLATLERLNQGLKIIKATGQYDQIYKKWFASLESPDPISEMWLKTLVWIILTFILIGALLLLWFFSLKKQVIARTRSIELEILNRKKVEQSLQGSNDKFLSLASNIPGYIAYVDAKTLKYDFVNDAFEKSFDIPRERIIGAHIKEIIGEKNYQFAKKYIDEVRSGKSISYENTFDLVSGKRWLQVNYAPVLDAAGQVVSIVVLSSDITDLKKAEDETRKAHEKLEATLDALLDLLFDVGLDGYVFDFHSPRTELLYLSDVDIIGKRVPDILPANVASIIMSAIKDAHEKGYSTGKQFELVVPKGTLWFEISVSRKASLPDEPHFIVLSRDITARKQAEDAMRESQTRYQLVFENSGTSNAIFDAECRLILQNSSSLQNLGTKPGESLGKTALEIFGPEQGLVVTQRMQRVLDSGLTEYFETAFELLAGIKWFRSTYQPIFDEQHTLVGVQIISQDITEHKQVEKNLLDSETQLRKAQHFAHIGSWTWNIKTNQLTWSDEMYNIFGLDKKTFSGDLADVIAQAIHPDDRAKVDQSNEAVVNEGKPSPLEYRIVWGDGSIHVVWAEAGEMLLDDVGAPSLLSGTVQEITERKRAEEILRASQERFKTIFEQAPLGIALIDPLNGHIYEANPRFAEIAGRSLEDMANIDWMNSAHSDDMQADRDNIARLNAGLINGYRMDALYVRPAGLAVWINMTIARLQVDDQAQPRHLCMIEDITERKRAEELIRKYASELEMHVDERTADLSRVNSDLARALRSRDEFLASMSHELRTPLTGILGLSEALQLNTFGEMNDEQQKTLSTIEESGRHLLDLINDILDLSKIEAGKLELHFAEFSIADVCQASLQLTKGMAHLKKQNVYYSPPSEPVIVRADARRLKQILVNLLGNAIKFTPENGELGLEIDANEAEKIVKLKVWDKGIGINSDDLHKLFKPFVQIDSSFARQYSGTGLGLSLAQRLTEMHNGGIEIESVFGKGSCFIVTLPWSPQASQPVPFEPDLAAGVLSNLPTSPKGSKSHLVMLADDNEMVLQMVADFLGTKQYRVLKVRSGAELLERVNDVHPDIVLVDIQMPGMDGLEAIRRLRAHPDALIAAVPMIAVTALAMPGDQEQCLQAGANVYMSKPLKLKELAVSIHELLEEKS
ncbi:MAG: PAS domain S-box protein [Chloroflexi bacterium]|nr:PAS domain S-box protein [Chloroflexota bacterium]